MSAQYPAPPGYGPPPPPAYQPPPAYGQNAYGPPQGYQAPPPVQAPPGSLDSFYSAPSTGEGPSLKFHQKPIGTRYAGYVARTVRDSDVRPQTDQRGNPLTYQDGRIKYVMIVPMLVAQSQDYPDGLARLYVKGQMRDDLSRAMTEAGVPETQVARGPEEGSLIDVELVGHRPIPGMSPQHLYRVNYQRPQGAAQNGTQPPAETSAPPAPPQAPPAPPAPPQGSMEPPQMPPPQAPPAPPAPPTQPAPPPPAEGQGQPALSPAQAELLKKLTGG